MGIRRRDFIKFGLAGVGGLALQPLTAKEVSAPRYDSLSSPVVTPSYIIEKNGTTIVAKNCTTGRIEFSGTDASKVIQSVINALDATGGMIFIKKGSYSITTGISRTPVSSITIAGEGKKTILRNETASSNLFLFTFNSHDHKIILKDIHFVQLNGNSLVQVQSADAEEKIDVFEMYGCYFSGATTPLSNHFVSHHIWRMIIKNCAFYYRATNLIDSESSFSVIDSCYFNNTIIRNTSMHVTITNCMFHNDASLEIFESGNYTVVKGCVFDGAWISAQSGAKGCIVENNIFSNYRYPRNVGMRLGNFTATPGIDALREFQVKNNVFENYSIQVWSYTEIGGNILPEVVIEGNQFIRSVGGYNDYWILVYLTENKTYGRIIIRNNSLMYGTKDAPIQIYNSVLGQGAIQELYIERNMIINPNERDNANDNPNSAGIAVYNWNIIKKAIIKDNIIIDNRDTPLMKWGVWFKPATSGKLLYENNKVENATSGPYTLANTTQGLTLRLHDLLDNQFQRSCFFDDFYGSALLPVWTVSAGTATMLNEISGAVRLTPLIGNWNSCRINWNDIPSLSVNKELMIEVRVRAALDPIFSKVDIKLVDNDDNYILFVYDLPTPQLVCVTRSGGVSTTTNYPLASRDTNYHTIRIETSPAEVRFSYDGLLIATHTTNIPTTNLEPAIYAINANTDTQEYDDLDYVYISQDR
ncbi:MAG: hypothetical protein H3Z53_03800 [archaeon]|nr:hypothetical protein [archaeon]